MFIAMLAIAAPLTANASPLTYCVPVKQFSLNPFIRLEDGKQLAYWILLFRSYISTADDSPGILDSYQFLPDGRTFRARLNAAAKWRDGTPVSAWEAAVGIAKGLRYRTFVDTAEVVGSKSLETIVDEQHPPTGIRLLSPQEFELIFETKISDFPAVLLEALSTNSRPNRVWPVRLGPLHAGEVLTHYPVSTNANGKIQIDVKGKQVELVNSVQDCKKADFSVYPDVFEKQSLSQYAIDAAPLQSMGSTSLLFANLNSRRLDSATRRRLATWMKNAFSRVGPEAGIHRTDTFFLDQDPERGTPSKVTLPAKDLRELRKRSFKIGYAVPPLKSVLEAKAQADGLKITFFPLPLGEQEVDMQLISSTFHRGRPVFLQVLLGWPWIRQFLSKAPLTTAALERVENLASASTARQDNGFEDLLKVSRQELALVPLAIKQGLTFSRKSCPLRLRRMAHGELRFLER